MQKYTKTFLTLFFLIIAIVGAVFFYLYLQDKASNPSIETVAVERRDLEEIVSVTGRVQPTKKVDLAFETTGKINVIATSVGQEVQEGESILSLDRTDLNLELSRAQANLENERALLLQYQATLAAETATLNELTRGTRVEDIQIAQTKVQNAEKAFIDANTQLQNVKTTGLQDIENLYDGSIDVINDIIVDYTAVMTLYTDEFFLSSTSSNEGNLVYPTANTTLETEIKNLRSKNLNNIDSLETSINTLEPNILVESVLDQAKNYLKEATLFLNKLNASLTESVGLTDDEKNTYQSSINTARLAIAAEQTAISTKLQQISSQKISNENAIDQAEAAITTAENNLSLAKDELTLKQAGNTSETIQSQQANVDRANANITAQNAKIKSSEAQLDLIQDQINDRILKSPIDGIITKLEVEQGEIVSPNQVLVSIISQGTLEIEANIPEVDIAKISIGNIADITLDAYGSDVPFQANVVQIDPAETIIEGVPTYTVTFQFIEQDDRVKSGMTANIDVKTDAVMDVLVVPQRSILYREGIRYARIYTNNQITEKTVETGLLSWDGLVEIKSGLEEGEQVVTFIEDAS